MGKRNKTVMLHNVLIPLILDERFIPPDLEGALEYYPSYRRYAQVTEPWSVQGYLCYILKQIDLIRPNGYDGNRAFGEFIRHAGFHRLAELFGMETAMGKSFKNITPKQILIDRRDKLDEAVQKRSQRRGELMEEIEDLNKMRNEFNVIIAMLENMEKMERE